MIDVGEAERMGHYLELSPVQMDDGPGWFGECRRRGPGYVRCFTFAPAYDANTLRRRWLEHVEESGSDARLAPTEEDHDATP